MATIEEWKRDKSAEIKASSYKPNNNDLDERYVNMSNRLTIASHSLTLAEKRIVCMAVSQIDSKAVSVRQGHATVRVTAADFAECMDIDIKTAYKQLKAAGDNLFHRQITFRVPNYVRRRNKDIQTADTVVKCRWVSEAKYQKDEGWVELTWTPTVYENLTLLKKNFTSYQLKQATALRSIYSWRLLELLMKFKSTGVAEYDVEDFKNAMEVPESMQDDFGQIRRRIIDAAIKELEAKDSWIIAYKTKKAGRRIDKIRFSFFRDPQGKLF